MGDCRDGDSHRFGEDSKEGCAAFRLAFIHSTNIDGPETALGPGNTVLYLVDKTSALEGGVGHRRKQIHSRPNLEGIKL